jgi:hypothetical protein
VKAEAVKGEDDDGGFWSGMGGGPGLGGIREAPGGAGRTKRAAAYKALEAAGGPAAAEAANAAAKANAEAWAAGWRPRAAEGDGEEVEDVLFVERAKIASILRERTANKVEVLNVGRL